MQKKYWVEQKGEYIFYHNADGAVLGTSGTALIEKDGFAFKDLAGCKELLPYEDWRLTPEERAQDLAERLSIEEIAGLMLYSSHQMVPFINRGPFQGHYDGKSFEEAGAEKWELTDEQKAFLKKDHLRHVLLMVTDSADTSARWSNELQKAAEGEKWGIPVNISSDPRHGSSAGGAEFKSASNVVSSWPEGIGMAATASEEMWKKYANAVSKEYRALGITTALGPQVDLATEPRWMRYEDTFGGDLKTSIRMAQVICNEMQTTEGASDGWGKDSIVVMAKHWPGGGTGEGGRDAHYGFGRYAVYPGENFESHAKVFVEGALRLDGPTKQAASIMPYYTVSWKQDTKNGENVGNSYNEYLIKDLLRGTYGYDGVLCTDWGITDDMGEEIDSFDDRCYGVEHLTVAERHLRIIMNGVDQFGGNNDSGPIIEAYAIGCERYGRETMEARYRKAAQRLLTNIFRLGLFENPYLDPEESTKIVGCEKFREEGYEAQKASVVLLKNKEKILPLQKGIKVYIPDRYLTDWKNFFRVQEEAQTLHLVPEEVSEKYFIRVDSPEEADAAICFIESPISDGYRKEDREQGGNGYLPISLQYRPYIAKAAREQSIAGGDPREEGRNRSYKGKTSIVRNEKDLDLILDTRKAMKEKPVIVCLRMHKPTVVAEFEKEADGILAEFGVTAEAIFDIIFGDGNPSGRLPVILPESMEAVEKHCEDVFDDYAPYKDSEGHIYTYGYGLSY